MGAGRCLREVVMSNQLRLQSPWLAHNTMAQLWQTSWEKPPGKTVGLENSRDLGMSCHELATHTWGTKATQKEHL